jgi:hypothetical protein
MVLAARLSTGVWGGVGDEFEVLAGSAEVVVRADVDMARSGSVALSLCFLFP